MDFVKRGGSVYFLPGHRDFSTGSASVRRLRGFLNSAFEHALDETDSEKKELDVMPQSACGDPPLLELTGNLGILLVSSEWWAQDWPNDPLANQGCEIKPRAGLLLPLQDALNSYRTRRLVIASHHPLRSYGEFGGAFTAGAHLSPAPLLGTAWVLARQSGAASPAGS